MTPARSADPGWNPARRAAGVVQLDGAGAWPAHGAVAAGQRRGSVSVVDPATGRVTTYLLGSRCLQVAAHGDRVVATCATANTVLVLDAGTGTVAHKATLPAPRMAAITGADVWVDTDAGLTRLTADLTIRTVYTGLTAGVGGDLAYAADALWLRGSDGTITQIDPTTGDLIERITPDQPMSGGSLLLAHDSIWTTSADQGTLHRLCHAT